MRTGNVPRLLLLVCLPLLGCQSPSGELRGLADQPPLDCAVLVTGGAFLERLPARAGTFAAAETPGEGGTDGGAAAADEPIPIEAVLDVLQRGRVFQRVAVDPDAGHRRRVRGELLPGAGNDELLQFLRQARDDGFDLLLVVEQLQDGPIDNQGTNSRWPLTFATWILLGVGLLIPDRTFESRATLKITVRDLQTGLVLDDQLKVAGPIDLALTERTDAWGLLMSILVPPFWVGDAPEVVSDSVRDVTQRRLLLSLARDLKSEPTRQRLRERAAASLTLLDSPAGPKVTVQSFEGLSVVRLRCEGAVDPAEVAAFERALLESVQRDGRRYRYEAAVPPGVGAARFQVLVGTIRGGVASATFSVAP